MVPTSRKSARHGAPSVVVASISATRPIPLRHSNSRSSVGRDYRVGEIEASPLREFIEMHLQRSLQVCY